MKCQGTDCKAVNGVGHSAACIAEHEATIDSAARMDTPGNRHPYCRYRGYILEPLPDHASEDQRAAWGEGRAARVA